jgi:hypothetical protein
MRWKERGVDDIDGGYDGMIGLKESGNGGSDNWWWWWIGWDYDAGLLHLMNVVLIVCVLIESSFHCLVC